MFLKKIIVYIHHFATFVKKNSSMKKLLSFLSKNKLYFVVFAVLVHTYIVHIATHVSGDQLIQIASVNNFLNGHGFTISSIDTNTYQVQYTKLEDWPLGYSLLVAPLLKITNYNFDLSELLMYFFSYLLLFFTTYKILLLIIPKEKQWSISILFIFFTFAHTPFRHLTSTDLLTVGFYLLIIYLIIIFFYKPHSLVKEILLILSISLLSAFLSFLRYAYYPHTLSIFCFFILGAIFFKIKITWKTIFYTFIIFSISALFTYFQINSQTYSLNLASQFLSGDATIINSAAKFLYSPFFNAFFTDYIIYNFYFQISGSLSIPLILFVSISFASLILLFFLIIITYRSFKYLINIIFKKNKDSFDSTHQPILNFINCTAIFTIICNLLFMFIIYKGFPFSWERLLGKSYLYESYPVISRYIVLTYYFTIIVFYLFIILNKINFLKKIIISLFIFSFIFQFTHWIYLRSKFSLYDRNENLSQLDFPSGCNSDLIELNNKISEEKKKLIYIISEATHINNYRHPSSVGLVQANGGIIATPRTFLALKNKKFLQNYKVIVAKDFSPEDSLINEILLKTPNTPYVNLNNCDLKLYQLTMNTND